MAFLVIPIVMLFWIIPLGERNVALQPTITLFLQLYSVLAVGGSVLYSVIKSLRQRKGKPFSLKGKIAGSVLVIWIFGGFALMIAVSMGKFELLPLLIGYATVPLFLGLPMVFAKWI